MGLAGGGLVGHGRAGRELAGPELVGPKLAGRIAMAHIELMPVDNESQQLGTGSKGALAGQRLEPLLQSLHRERLHIGRQWSTERNHCIHRRMLCSWARLERRQRRAQQPETL